MLFNTKNERWHNVGIQLAFIIGVDK